MLIFSLIDIRLIQLIKKSIRPLNPFIRINSKFCSPSLGILDPNIPSTFSHLVTKKIKVIIYYVFLSIPPSPYFYQFLFLLIFINSSILHIFINSSSSLFLSIPPFSLFLSIPPFSLFLSIPPFSLFLSIPFYIYQFLFVNSIDSSTFLFQSFSSLRLFYQLLIFSLIDLRLIQLIKKIIRPFNSFIRIIQNFGFSFAWNSRS